MRLRLLDYNSNLLGENSILYRNTIMKAGKIQISIPEPCHENWLEMKPVHKDRFCNSCQKNVFDFTNSSDREIAAAFEKDKNVCGRFQNSQLQRDLIIPQQKNSFWLATTSAIICFIGFGTNEALAQGNVTIEQIDKKIATDSIKNIEKEFVINGSIWDDKGPIPNANVILKNSLKHTVADIDGNFSIKVKHNDILVISSIGYNDKEIKVINQNDLKIIIVESKNSNTILSISVGGAFSSNYIRKKDKTFFGRIFQSIGNLFR